MANGNKAGKTVTKSSKGNTRRKNATQTRKPDLLLIIGGALLALLIGTAVFFNVRGARPVEGEIRFQAQGNVHIEEGQANSFAYNSTPPTSGPHYGSMAPWGIRNEPVPYEYLLHNLEDGGIVIYYQCDDNCSELRQTLEEVVDPYVRAEQRVVLVRNDPTWSNDVAGHVSMETPIAVTAWTRLLPLETVDADRIRGFVSKYMGIDNHRG